MSSLKIELIAVGTRIPRWMQEGIEYYSTRMRKECQFLMTEIQTTARGNKPVDLVKEDESKALLLNVSPYAYSIAMDRGGKNWSTEQFAGKLESWSQQTNHFQFLIGGPDGLGSRCLSEANEIWSLSKLTFPHLMARLLVVEQVYRALMFNAGHPYHK